ncbi:alpha/beta hydrolase, partial [Nocardia farcinica]|uniref:alpha/beta hydrolase n=2 Tax=Nocardia farcinica TaxID=37329 RepID=UPI0024556AE6
MESRRITVGDRTFTVRVDGPETRHTVLLLPDVGDPVDVFDQVVARLTTSDLRTLAVESVEGLEPADVHALLDALGVPYAHVAGRGAGAEIGWQLCSGPFGRFISLVVADRAHPAVPGPDGTVADTHCRPLELPVTVLVTKGLPRAGGAPARPPRKRAITGGGVGRGKLAPQAPHPIGTPIRGTP